MAKRKPTLAAGATIQRTLIRRWIQRERARVWQAEAQGVLTRLSDWISAQPKRAAKHGGIGR